MPAIRDFVIPLSIMKRHTARSLEDIVDILEHNQVATDMAEALRDFAEENKCDEFNFDAAQHGGKLSADYPRVGPLLAQYVEKCQYELRVPKFKPATFSKADEKKFAKYMEGECPGIIKHDRDLLKYFLLTDATLPGLSALLVDIVDRVSVADEHPMDLASFTQKSFFKQLNKSQGMAGCHGVRLSWTCEKHV